MTSSFTNTFGGSSVSPADVAYAAYSFGATTHLYWPQFAAGQTNVAARFMSIVTTASSVNIVMPDATLNSVGYDAIIFNGGSNSFNVVNYATGSIVTIAPAQTYYLMMTSNAVQAGTWLTVQFGVGTGSANAAALAGMGLLASAGLLEVNFVVNSATSSFSITAAGRGQLYNWTGGAGTITLPLASSVGTGFFFMLANNGSGSISVATTGGTTIDGQSTSSFSQTQSGFIISDGTNWETVGKGIQNTFAVTLLNLNVAGSSNVTETSAQAQNIIQQFTGVLTGNINVIVPATVQLYFCNNLTTGSYTLTVKTASGTGIQVAQGSSAILYCDGTNVVNAYTATISGSLVLSAGSATAPSLTFSGNTTTGLFSPGAGLISVTASSTETFRFAAQASAVNYFGAVATASGVSLTLGAVGTDANINISLVPKGTGYVTLGYLDNTAIGSNVAASAAFTSLSASATVSGTGFSTYLASPPAIGGSAPAAGSFTTLSANSTVSGTGFSTYLASPPAIGGTAAAAGSFTTLSASGNATVSGTLSTTGLAGFGTAPSTYQIQVVQAGQNQAYFGSTGSNASKIVLDNAAGSQFDQIIMSDAGTAKWTIQKDTGNNLFIVDNVNSKIFLEAVAGGNLVLGGAQTTNIDQSGNVGIGTATTGSYRLNVAASGNSQANFLSSTGTAAVNISSAPGSAYGGALQFYNGSTQDWTLFTGGTSGNTFVLNDSVGAKYFLTAVSGGSLNLGPAQTFNLDQSGNATLGGTQLGTAKISLTNPNVNGYAQRNSTASAGKYWLWNVDSSNSCIFANNGGSGVYVSDGGTSWGTFSDARLKTNVTEITGGLAKIQAIRGVTYSFLSDPTNEMHSGVIAQEVQAVFPIAVSNAPMKAGDNTQYLGVQYTDLIPVLISAVKELEAQVTALTARLTAAGIA